MRTNQHEGVLRRLSSSGGLETATTLARLLRKRFRYSVNTYKYPSTGNILVILGAAPYADTMEEAFDEGLFQIAFMVSANGRIFRLYKGNKPENLQIAEFRKGDETKAVAVAAVTVEKYS